MEGAPPSTSNGGLSQFPAFAPDVVSHYDDGAHRRSTSSPNREFTLRPSLENERLQPAAWQARRSSKSKYTNSRGRAHGRQRSLSEAIHVIRERKGSMSQNAQEIADALKAPVSPRLVVLCAAWYGVSMLANTSAGQILNTFPKPVTLTIIQFAFVTSWCVFLSWLSGIYPALKEHVPALRNGLRRPDRDIISTTLPLTGFMIGGHILTSDAMSRIPVSLVHTIKGLSPLFTVLAYRFICTPRTHYNYPTYLSLLPLTIGVVMACSTSFSSNLLGLCSAFASAVLFVTQNIVSKKLFNQAAAAESDPGPIRGRKPDKLNLLCYSSALAFCFTVPIWLWSEGFSIIGDFLHNATLDLNQKQGTLNHGRLLLEYVFNGTFHFAQSLVAFTLLAMVSPVTYSVASLIKRVFVICFALVWFGNTVTGVQGLGIGLTFLGLYLYDRTSDSGRAERKARIRDMPPPLLPVTEGSYEGIPSFMESPAVVNPVPLRPYNGGAAEEKRQEEATMGVVHPNKPDGSGWLAPGTRAQETWSTKDTRHSVAAT